MEKKRVGRPRTASAQKKREDNKARQARFRRNQRLIKIIAERLLTAKGQHRAGWLEFLAFAIGCGEDHYVGVEWENGGTSKYFSQLAEELLGEKESPASLHGSYGAIVEIRL